MQRSYVQHKRKNGESQWAEPVKKEKLKIGNERVSKNMKVLESKEKSAILSIEQNITVFGGRKLSGCRAGKVTVQKLPEVTENGDQ